MDFKSFKKKNKKFIEKAKTLNMPKNDYSDSRFWNPTKDDAGNGGALIRFLPQKDIEKNPIAMVMQHFFKENGKWFNEKCPTTWDKECPICDYCQPLWDFADNTPEKDSAFKYGRKKQYYANILVINDPSKPENNNKVFIFKFGAKIYEKIQNKVNPESELDTEVAVYDLWEGMNFKLKIKKVAGFPNYDSSEFDGPIGAISDDEKTMEEIYNQIYDLDEFIDEEKLCKEEDILSDKFYSFINKKKTNTQNTNKKETNKEEHKEEEHKEEEQNHKEEDIKLDPEKEEDATNEILDDDDWDWD